MKVFMSYRRDEDSKSYIVGNIHERLSAALGLQNVFRDTNNISGGEEWRSVLERALNECTVMLVIIGPDWTTLSLPSGQKRLFDPGDITRWEVETGLKRNKEKKATVIPVLVMDAKIPTTSELPESLHELLNRNVVRLRNYPDFNHDFDILVRDIRQSPGFASSAIPIEYYEPETIHVFEGPFWMGSEAREGIPHYETPLHHVSLPAFRLGKYPVTNIQYEYFVTSTRKEVPKQLGWEGQRVPKGLDDVPVTGVTWYEALEYCAWLSRETSREYSLPSEAQWEKACRGGKRCFYPWGDDFDPARCNSGQPAIAPVNRYPAQNDFGCFDLVGNVRQWTCTVWEQGDGPQESPYPWKEDRRNDLKANSETPRALRGSSMKDSPLLHRCSARRGDLPESRGYVGARYGFRVMLKV
jgi:formylglycine-generating enzyme required for sulfatase activity